MAEKRGNWKIVLVVIVIVAVLGLVIFFLVNRQASTNLSPQNWCGCQCPVGYYPAPSSNDICLTNACGGSCGCIRDGVLILNKFQAFFCAVLDGANACSSINVNNGICNANSCTSDNQCQGACGPNSPQGSYDCCLDNLCGCCLEGG